MTGSEPRPYWRDVGTVDAFWQANIDLTDFVPELDIYSEDWPIWTYGEVTPPAKFIHDQDGRLIGQGGGVFRYRGQGGSKPGGTKPGGTKPGGRSGA